MPVSRMRMRPWLEKMIDSNTVKGLTWVDKERTMFSIPWKHAARHGWELDKDACLFKQWAIHTGKHVEGKTSDPKTWKANFRCAMNSLPDIEEVKDRSINKGHQAVRVFKMLPETRKSREKRSKARDTKQKRRNQNIKQEEDTDYSDTQSPGSTSLLDESMSTQENTVDSTMRTDMEDFPLIAPSEVPDFCTSVTIGSDLSNPFCPRFEVSPDHIPDYNDANDIIEICRQLERDSLWMSGTSENMGILSNEACTSPESQWSDVSSVDELEELPQYTLLGSDLQNSTDDSLCDFYQRLYLTL